MTYVVDTSSFRVLGHYFPDRFPSFWARFNEAVASSRIYSVREVYKELERQVTRQHLLDWAKSNRAIFCAPTAEETHFIAQIFAVLHFRYLISQKQVLTGGPAADPFVIAAANARGACVVTEEARKENAARIPNVCDHFGIRCCSLESLMEQEGWSF